jgi:site-specific DNA-cytosine methylase
VQAAITFPHESASRPIHPFDIGSAYGQRFLQIANAVPPLLAEAVLRTVL